MSVISVIVGTTREARFSEKPAHWILEHLKKRQDVDARLLDLRDFPMPFFDQPLTPAMPGRPAFENEAVQRWTAAIGASDGYVIATAEYNYGPAAVLKNDRLGLPGMAAQAGQLHKLGFGSRHAERAAAPRNGDRASTRPNPLFGPHPGIDADGSLPGW